MLDVISKSPAKLDNRDITEVLKMDQETKKLLIEKKAVLKQVKSIGTILEIAGLAVGILIFYMSKSSIWESWDIYAAIGAVVLGFIIDISCTAEITEIEKKLTE